MRRLFFSVLMFCVLPAWADGHDQLYKVAGWPEQRAHFNDALNAAQQRYQNSLPPAVYQALVDNSNQRFDPKAVDTILNLGERGLRSVVLIPLGYRADEGDWLANLKKVRRSRENFVTEVV